MFHFRQNEQLHSANNDIINWNMNQLDEKTNETHD